MGDPRSARSSRRRHRVALNHLAVLGGQPAFDESLHVGRPNVGDRDRLLRRIEAVLDRAWFTNHGPMVQEFEAVLADRLGVRNVVAVANGTLGLEIATRAVGATGEVIVPSFTFAATPHAVRWQGMVPQFADIGSGAHVLDPASVEGLITSKTSTIIGVHTWGEPCAIRELEAIAAQHGLALLFDAAHAMGCTHEQSPIGGNGAAEVFSFHATKYVNAFEGGAVATNDDALADSIRHMSNFGFEGHDVVGSVGTNAKMNEVSAAMGLTSLESEPHFAAYNREMWEAYAEGLADIPGLSLRRYSATEQNSHQYVVVEVDRCETGLSRDAVLAALQAEGCLARRYFFPGCHRMEPYASERSLGAAALPNTEALTGRVMILPTGTAMSAERVGKVCALIARIIEQAEILAGEKRT